MIEVLTLGVARIGPNVNVQARTMELVALLAEHGGPMPRTLLEDTLFAQVVGSSSVATLVYRARKLGLQINFLEGLEAYVLTTPVRCDHLQVLSLLDTRDWPQILHLYRGPFLAKSRGGYAQAMRAFISDRMVECALQENDVTLLCQLTKVMPEAPALWEHLADLGHARATVMRNAMRKGLGAHERNA